MRLGYRHPPGEKVSLREEEFSDSERYLSLKAGGHADNRVGPARASTVRPARTQGWGREGARSELASAAATGPRGRSPLHRKNSVKRTTPRTSALSPQNRTKKRKANKRCEPGKPGVQLWAKLGTTWR